MKYQGPILKLTNIPFAINDVATGGFVKVQFKEIVDGDTAYFFIQGKEEKVRLFIVNTPEIFPNCEPYGLDAKNYSLNVLSHAKKIFLQSDPNDHLRDETPSKRLLAWVWVDNQLLNYKLVEKGYAKVQYVYHEKMLYLDDLKKAEKIAIQKNRRLFKNRKDSLYAINR